VARQTRLPVWCEEPERVPALAAPGIRHLTTFEHQVIDRPVVEASAGSEAGMAGPDDHRGNPFDCYTTSTVTFTGLVMAS
jgi:hypothetical protein